MGHDEYLSIYIGDHLTREATDILKKAKLFRNKGNILSTWTFNGNVYVRKTEEDRAVKITNFEQLDRYVEIIHRTEDLRDHNTKNMRLKRSQTKK